MKELIQRHDVSGDVGDETSKRELQEASAEVPEDVGVEPRLEAGDQEAEAAVPYDEGESHKAAVKAAASPPPVRWEVHLIRALASMPAEEADKLLDCTRDKIIAALRDREVLGQLSKEELAFLMALLIK